MKRLYKNTQEKMLCGVCKGLSEYFDIDVSLNDSTPSKAALAIATIAMIPNKPEKTPLAS